MFRDQLSRHLNDVRTLSSSAEQDGDQLCRGERFRAERLEALPWPIFLRHLTDFEGRRQDEILSPQLFEQFVQRLAEAEKRIEMAVCAERREFGLRRADHFAARCRSTYQARRRSASFAVAR